MTASAQNITLEKHKNLCDSFYSNAAQKADFDSAIYYARLTEQLTKQESGDNSHEYARVCDQFMGMCLEAGGYYTDALKWYTKAVSIFEANKDSTIDYADALANTGNILNEKFGSYLQARKYLLTSRRLCERLHAVLQPGYFAVLNNLANGYYYTGNFILAEKIWLQVTDALNLFSAFADKNSRPFIDDKLALVNNNIASLYYDWGNLEKAVQFSSIAVASEKKLGQQFADSYIRMATTLMNLYTTNGEYKKADSLLRENFNHELTDTTSLTYTSLLSARANFNHATGHLQKSIEDHSKVIQILRTLGIENSYLFISSLYNLASVYIEKKEYLRADSILETAFYEIKESGQLQSISGRKIAAGHIYCLLQLKKTDEAKKVTIQLGNILFGAVYQNFQGMSFKEQLAYITSLYSYFDSQYCILENIKPGTDKDFIKTCFSDNLKLKNIVLSNQANLIDRLRSNTDSSINKLASLIKTEKQMLNLQYSFNPSNRYLNTDSIETEINKNEKDLTVLFPTYKRADVSFDAIKHTLKDNEALIEFIAYHNTNNEIRYAAFVCTNKNDYPLFINLCAEKNIQSLMQDTKGNWIPEKQLANILYNTAFKESSQKIYTLLWKPLEKYIRNKTTVYYSTTGLIDKIPVNAIPVSSTSDIGSRYQLHRLLNAADYFAGKSTTSGKRKIILFGNMSYDEQNLHATTTTSVPISMYASELSLDKKPFATLNSKGYDSLKNYLKAIQYPFSSYEKENATEDIFKQTDFSQAKFLHISTHGFYTQYRQTTCCNSLPADYLPAIKNPLLRCGVVFSGVNTFWTQGKTNDSVNDEILNGLEVSQLDLSGIEILSLNACETGLGDIAGNEGTIGLPSAFKLAGVNKMLVSLWQVNANASDDMILEFYKNLLSGASAADAFAKAQQFIKRKYSLPYYWAGFVLLE